MSAGALAYVFTSLDWEQLVEATRGANLPLYLTFTVLDKLIFFLWWGTLQAAAIRRFVSPIGTFKVISIRGGAELVRTANGPLADAAFMFGVSRVTNGSVAAVAAAVGVPFVCHFTILLLQTTVALSFLDGGLGANRDVVAIGAVGWSAVITVALLVRYGPFERWFASSTLGSWLRGLSLRSLAPFMLWFGLFSAFDVLIQGLASRAFGIDIPWWALAARIPILYTFLALPSFGGFGTRELTWAASFVDYAPQETLVAYALATNAIFLLMHVVIGMIFLPRAISLISDMRKAKNEGETVRVPFLRDASDP